MARWIADDESLAQAVAERGGRNVQAFGRIGKGAAVFYRR